MLGCQAAEELEGRTAPETNTLISLNGAGFCCWFRISPDPHDPDLGSETCGRGAALLIFFTDFFFYLYNQTLFGFLLFSPPAE